MVAPIVANLVNGTLERWELWLPRNKCSSCHRSSTCYPQGVYPHRQYQLDVISGVGAAIVLGKQSVAKVCEEQGVSVSSGRRWTSWLAELAVPGDLRALAAKLDPRAAVGSGMSVLFEARASRPTHQRAALVQSALEQAGAALARLGIATWARTGLGRVLGWQFDAHRVLVRLVVPPTKLSPALELAQAASGP
ncbi:MAG: hypothetical protein A3K18_15140 [Lentisphaerae bacterium RIFOXYA12_64_32]|nr:MAG: hypothetical protein A3K18_15140 [Lentisphaerae bacterium RIFOXYA12_64_32]